MLRHCADGKEVVRNLKVDQLVDCAEVTAQKVELDKELLRGLKRSKGKTTVCRQHWSEGAYEHCGHNDLPGHSTEDETRALPVRLNLAQLHRPSACVANHC